MSTHVEHPEPVAVPEDLSADEFGEHQHGATDKQYIIIAVILAVVTAAEVSITYLDVGALLLPILLILMIAKFLTVVSYFMHLKFDKRIFAFLFYTGVGLAVGVYCVALATFHFFGS